MNQVTDYRLHHGSLGILLSCTFLLIAVQLNLFPSHCTCLELYQLLQRIQKCFLRKTLFSQNRKHVAIKASPVKIPAVPAE